MRKDHRKISDGFRYIEHLEGVLIFDTSFLIPPFMNFKRSGRWRFDGDDVKHYLKHIDNLLRMNRSCVASNVASEILYTIPLLSSIHKERFEKYIELAGMVDKEMEVTYKNLIDGLRIIEEYARSFRENHRDCIISPPDIGRLYSYFIKETKKIVYDEMLWDEIEGNVDRCDGSASLRDRVSVAVSLYLSTLYESPVNILSRDKDMVELLRSKELGGYRKSKLSVVGFDDRMNLRIEQFS